MLCGVNKFVYIVKYTHTHTCVTIMKEKEPGILMRVDLVRCTGEWLKREKGDEKWYNYITLPQNETIENLSIKSILLLQDLEIFL